MINKTIYLLAAVTVGGIFAWLKVPAGWLLGSILAGIICSFFIIKLYLPNKLFNVVLAIIGGNIGLMLRPEQFLNYQALILPFLLTLVTTIAGGLLLGKFLKRFSNLNHNTAFFCCLPGGASEVIALSHKYGANEQIVAAFHTTRITLFVLVIPLVVGMNVSVIGQQNLLLNSSVLLQAIWAILILLVITVATLFFSQKFTFPGASLFFAIGLGFTGHILFPSIEVPGFIMGMAQAIMGAIIGIRFDRQSLLQLKSIGGISAVTLLIYFLMSLALATIFFLLTPIDWFTSLLGIVAAGAAEMASTAAALNLDAAMVATLQMARVLALFLALPFLIKLFAEKNQTQKSEG
ncbi:AbrB family transcriptional regulator [Halalkalibacter akibai]|uniref:Putative ammonia monooxygenase n=1 Tax=Halalkalibacter akibai (strain ATCC 43226 / DSM 21942 / CIP 109018 / JCM 9157 / 1139) TaxID=1236973 RepID=W4QVL2_HALA3|nr:AbrB family transcriptional regulator [Halalkalibacter akibai]GAE35912.1 putative ammonia monooxygenase [Halalkalibacter akibai JCM 9157]